MIKALSKAHITHVKSPLKKTNILLKNPNFRVATKLWEFLQNYDDEMAQQLLNIEIIRAWIKFKQIKSTEEIMEFILNSEEKYGLLSETDIEMFFESRNRDGDGFEAVFGFYDE